MAKGYNLEQTGPQVQEAINKSLNLTTATQSKEGLMSAQDKQKLDSLDSELGGKVDKVPGKGLSTNDYDNSEKSKVASAYQKPNTGIPKEDLSDGVKASLGNADSASQDVADIKTKIPSQATDQNQLADKDFVNSSIATATADFKGTYDSLSELQAVTADKNDYGYVVSTDQSGNTVYSRYKYNGSAWVFEYDLNNSSFTAAEWASIQSQITAALVQKLSALPTNQELGQSLSGKQDIIHDLSTIRSGANAGATAYQKPDSGIPASDMASGVIPEDVVKYASQTLTDSQKTQARTNIGAASEEELDAISRGEYVEAWDGVSEPVVAEIPSGVQVEYNSQTYTGTLAASNDTLGKIYLVGTGSTDEYNRYRTSRSGVEGSYTYSWVPLGSTQMNLSGFATKNEISQLQQEVDGIEVKTFDLSKYSPVMALPGGSNKWVSLNPTYPYMGYFFPVNGGDKICILGDSDKTFLYCFLTNPNYENGTNVDYATGFSGKGKNTALGGEIVVAPDNAKFLYVKVSNDGGETYTGPTKVGIVSDLQAIIGETIEEESGSAIDVKIDGQKINYISGRYLYSNGITYANADWSYTSDYIPIKQGDMVLWRPGLVRADSCIVIYNSNKEVLGYFTANATARTLKISQSNAAYIRVSFATASIDSNPVVINSKISWKPIKQDTIGINEEIAGINATIEGIKDSSTQNIIVDGGTERILPTIFNGNVGNPGNLNQIRTDLIKVVPGSTVKVRPNVALQQGYTYGFGYRTYKSDGSAWRSVAASADGVGKQVYTTTSVENYVIFEIAAYDSDNNAVSLRAPSYQGILDVLIEYPQTINPSEYLPLIGQLSYSPSEVPSRQSNPLVLLHFSDIHGSMENYERIVSFRRDMKGLIDDVISTGDNVYNSFADNFAYWIDRTFLNTIGNHDTADYSGGVYDWTAHAGKDAYDRYFAPFISHWGVIQPENAGEQGYCYYYKDYSTQGIRLIVLDVMGWDANQLSWLGGVLDNAKTNSLSVVIAIHGPAKTEDVTPMQSGWMTYFGWSGSSNTIPDDAISAVDTFIEGGGVFICWFAGHTHRDQVGYLPEHHNQLCVIVGTATIETTNAGYGDCYRAKYTKTQDLFNVIAFDTTEHQVRVVRVGATTNKHFQMRHTLVIGFDESGATAPVIISET